MCPASDATPNENRLLSKLSARQAEIDTERENYGYRQAERAARQGGEPKLTDEQHAIIMARRQHDGDGVVEAYAGSGKTFILRRLAKDQPRDRFFVIAYNRSIADELSKTFSRNATCRTMHSVAFRAVGVNYKHKLNGPRQRWSDVAWLLGIKAPFKLDDKRMLRPSTLAGIVLDTVRRFCYSADDNLGTQHVPFTPGTEGQHDDLAKMIAAFAVKAWQDITKIDGGKVSWGKSHDYYLKMWALEHPVIKTDCLMVDEAQDLNPVVTNVVMEQECQKILVGDPYQQLYAWRGAQDAMAGFQCDWRLTLSQSFRFGEAVAAEGDKWLRLLGAEKTLKGFDGIDSQVDECPHARTILTRTNATVIAEAMQLQEEGKQVHIVGGTGEIMSFARAVQQLQTNALMPEKDRVPITHPDLMAFESWQDVKEYVQEEGGDLRVLVDMVDRYGVGAIINVANQAVNDEQYADHILSTAHKAKGREWDSVRIAGDFRQPERDPLTGEWQIDRPEFMLLYVAVTRAQKILDNGTVKWVDDLLMQHTPTTTEPTNQKPLQRARHKARERAN